MGWTRSRKQAEVKAMGWIDILRNTGADYGVRHGSVWFETDGGRTGVIIESMACPALNAELFLGVGPIGYQSAVLISPPGVDRLKFNFSSNQ